LEPPCETCRAPLLPANEEAVIVWSAVQDQVVTAGMGEPVDLDIGAVKIIMDLQRVEDQLGCLRRVRRVFRHFAEIDRLRSGKL